MKVRKGFSTKYAELKFDVEVDEDDLTRLLMEHQIPPDQAPRLTTTMVFRLQVTLAEWLMLVEAAKLPDQHPDKPEAARAAYYATADSVRVELGLTPLYAAPGALLQGAGAPG
jgi:hypothetical protein